MAERLILDSGAVIQASRGDRRVRSMLEAARRLDVPVIIPPVVLAQTLRGGSADSAILQVVRLGFVSFVGARVARLAGQLLGAAGLDDAADGLVAAEAVRGDTCLLLTTDPHDMRRLVAGHPRVQVTAV